MLHYITGVAKTRLESRTLLSQNTFNNVRVLRTKYFVSLQLFVQAQYDVRHSNPSDTLI
jgi:hypothetical protein